VGDVLDDVAEDEIDELFDSFLGARRTETSALAREREQPVLAAAIAMQTGETELEDATFSVATKGSDYLFGKGSIGVQEVFEVLGEDGV